MIISRSWKMVETGMKEPFHWLFVMNIPERSIPCLPKASITYPRFVLLWMTFCRNNLIMAPANGLWLPPSPALRKRNTERGYWIIDQPSVILSSLDPLRDPRPFVRIIMNLCSTKVSFHRQVFFSQSSLLLQGFQCTYVRGPFKRYPGGGGE